MTAEKPSLNEERITIAALRAAMAKLAQDFQTAVSKV